ncbi:MAG: hypothetical protein IT359_10470 [Gemmatimonadaceae bacterium]|nr:hypothetical protein [Gemmatimonadaceae bacterium]
MRVSLRLPLAAALAVLQACRPSHETSRAGSDAARDASPQRTGTTLTTSDTALATIWEWARDKSNGYVGDDADPVGPWYEAALPGREAFCVRDVSHQSIGAEILGHSRQNLNMLRRFVENIAESRDYCTYWEIDRRNRPAPVDYASDDDFWYNLNANFDIIDASYRLYQWTGNRTYLEDPAFDRFFRLTLKEYIERWQLQPDRIMHRPAFPNLRPGTVKYRKARGIPSYDEQQDSLVLGSDLLGMILNGFTTYARILAARGDSAAGTPYLAEAAHYKQLLDERWWDERTQLYHDFLRANGTFTPGAASGSDFLLWYGVVDDPARIRRALAALRNAQVEVLSYLPMLFYRYGEDSAAYYFLRRLHADPRRDYPEASSGAVEGIVRGLLGVEPSARDNRIVTLPHLTPATAWAAATGVPTFAGPVSVRHDGLTSTTFMHNGARAVTWRAAFPGTARAIVVDGRRVTATAGSDAVGHPFVWVDVEVAPGREIRATAVS